MVSVFLSVQQVMSQFPIDDDSISSPDDLDTVCDNRPMAAQPKNAKGKRRKVSAEWNEEKIVSLIAAVESQDCLWNAGHKDYKNRNLRSKVWDEIAENIFKNGFNADELGAKWSNLRIQFKSYHAKAKQSKSGQGANEKQISWKYYSHMLFVAAAEEEQSTQSVSNLVSYTNSNYF